MLPRWRAFWRVEAFPQKSERPGWIFLKSRVIHWISCFQVHENFRGSLPAELIRGFLWILQIQWWFPIENPVFEVQNGRSRTCKSTLCKTCHSWHSRVVSTSVHCPHLVPISKMYWPFSADATDFLIFCKTPKTCWHHRAPPFRYQMGSGLLACREPKNGATFWMEKMSRPQAVINASQKCSTSCRTKSSKLHLRQPFKAHSHSTPAIFYAWLTIDFQLSTSL